jgi:anti-sigma factor RsiW
VKHCNPYGLSRYLDAELQLADRSEIEAHLKVCHRCTKELELLRRLDRELRAWGQRRRAMPVQSEMRILESVDRRRLARPVRALARMMPAAVGTSIAAVLVLLSVNWGLVNSGSTHVASQAATVRIQRSRIIQAPLAVDVVRVRQITGQRGNPHSDLESRYRNLGRGMVSLD